MKEWISKHKRKWFISFFVFLFIIPLAINTFFKIKAPCAFFVAEWSAGDALSFYGTMLASVATIIGVYMSIRYAQKSYRDDIRNQVLPFFAVTQLRGKSHYDPFLDGWNVTENPEHENQSDISSAQYEESKLSNIYFCLEESGIKNYTDLPSRYTELLEKGGASWVTAAQGCSLLQKHPFISFPMEVENIGNGPAVYVRIGFFKDGEAPKYLPPVNLKVGESFYIHIFSAIPIEKTYGKYMLSIQYQDIYKNSYSQEFSFIAEEKGYCLDLEATQVCKVSAV